MAKPKSADEYIKNHPEWRKSLKFLQNLIEETELEESIKWGIPVYTISGKNVVGLSGFKNHFGLWFYNGALLEDPDGHLYNAQKGKTKAMRQLRYSSFEEINADVAKDFLNQAIANQKAGKEVKIDTKRDARIPPFLENAFSKDEKLKSHFEKLTPGRQREYAEYIATAKQESTKRRRLDKIIPMVKRGVGLNDKYQK